MLISADEATVARHINTAAIGSVRGSYKCLQAVLTLDVQRIVPGKFSGTTIQDTKTLDDQGRNLSLKIPPRRLHRFRTFPLLRNDERDTQR